MSKTPNDENEFYEELDKNGIHRSCCSFPTMIVLFVVILAFAVGLLVFGYEKLKTSNFPPSIITTVSDKNNYFAKVNSDKLEPTIEVTVSSSELTAMAREGLSYKRYLVKDSVFVISEVEVDFYGTLTKPIGSDLKIVTHPIVENGKIKWQISKITAGKLEIPDFIANDFQNGLNNMMDVNFQTLYENYNITSIELAIDKMTIKGNLK